MSNRTELMKKILKSEQAQKIIDEISPVYGESYVCLWLFQIIGKELDKLDDFVQNLRDETVIQTADQWALKYWEEQYGEIEAPHLPEEERRQNIMEKIRKNYHNPRQMENALSVLTGYQVQIEENTEKNNFDVLVRGYTQDLTGAKEFIDKVKPAHLTYEIRVSELIQAVVNIYCGCAISEHEHYEVTVLYLDAEITK